LPGYTKVSGSYSKDRRSADGVIDPTADPP
jgi:hypothetical protein